MTSISSYLLSVTLLLLASCASTRHVGLCVLRTRASSTCCVTAFPADDFVLVQTQDGVPAVSIRISPEAERFFRDFAACASGSTVELLDPQTGDVLITVPRLHWLGSAAPNPFSFTTEETDRDLAVRRCVHVLRRLESVYLAPGVLRRAP